MRVDLIGRQIGSYKVLALLGVGGMGEVYRARDSKLGRDVALKVLPARFTEDHDRVARFEREACLLASLNHAHIGAIYGFENASSVCALVLELVEGPTLADRLAIGPLPATEALNIAGQIAEALEAAHEKGIIHRDLKPANIKIRADGAVKVLDFGMAKASAGNSAAPDISQLPTMAIDATPDGMIIGTPAYMSPEQARGQAVDKRTDIWAFGCVLYEMLTGRPAFAGDSASDTIAAILERQPDWSILQSATLHRIRLLLERCLDKDAKRRLRDVGEARIAIEETIAEPAEGIFLERSSSRAGRPERLAARWFSGLALIAVLAWMAFSYFKIPSTDTRSFRISILPPSDTSVSLSNTPSPAQRFSLSPDGRRLVFMAAGPDGVSRLWLRLLDAASAQPLPETAGGAAPFWSPDSRQLAFLADGKLKKLDIAGGPTVTVADRACCTTGNWNRDDVILFMQASNGPLYRVPASGGPPTPVTTLEEASGDIQHSDPFFLPDGRHFLFLVIGGKTNRNEARATYVGSLVPSEKSRLVLQGGSNAKYAEGHLFFLRDSTLMAQPFDAARLVLSGAETPLAHEIEIGGRTGRTGAFSVSEAGVLAYQTGSKVRSQLVWLDRSGKHIAAVGDQGDYGDVELSPDGKRATVSLLDPMTRTRDIWIYDLPRGVRTRFTFNAGDEFRGIWSPDQSRIVFNSRRSGRLDLYQRTSEGAGDEELLLADNFDKYPESWSPDGRFISYHTRTQAGDLWVLPLFGDRKPIPFTQTQFNEGAPARFSPDGRWIAYWSDESGRDEVYVAGFPKSRGKWLVSAGGGDWPRWGPEGKEIFYLASDNRKLMAVQVRYRGSALEMAPPRMLFEIRPRIGRYPYDVAADGQRFLVNMLVGEAPTAPITLLVNWPALLQK